MEQSVLSGTGLAATVVIDLPVRLPRGKAFAVAPLPILITMTEGKPVVPPEAFAFAVDRAKIEPFATLRQMLVTVARLHDDWVASAIPLESADDADTVIWNYAWGRLCGDRPVAYETVRTEFRYITKFARFCRLNSSLRSPFGTALAKGSRLFGEEMPIQKSQGFLLHLEAQRRRWLELQDFEAAFPTDLRKAAGPRTAMSNKVVKFPTISQMDDLIDLERNPIFRAAWCQLAGQGPRFSELLQMWRCDVLPGSYGRSYFSPGHPVEQPLLIYAHPSRSVWIGSNYSRGGGAQNRKSFLATYGLLPGNERVRCGFR